MADPAAGPGVPVIPVEEPGKPRITVFTFSYPPAYLAGGPARSVHGLVQALAADFNFCVIAPAFDASADRPLECVRTGGWHAQGRAAVWYEPRFRMPALTAARLIRDTAPDVIYLNSLLEFRYALLPLLIARVTCRGVPVVLAPRGELAAGALDLKRLKKQLFLAAFRVSRLHKYVVWHASTTEEKASIERQFGRGTRIHVAIDLRTGLTGGGGDGQEHKPDLSRSPGSSLVFFSRITPKKNVLGVLEALTLIRSEAHLSIAGPVEDSGYWQQCLTWIGGLDGPAAATYVGTVPGAEAVAFLRQFDLMVLPTMGENFGHVVLESLAAGTPVIVGKDTPWRQIEAAGAGWLCDPADPQGLARLIDRFLAMDAGERGRMGATARELAAQLLNDPVGIGQNRELFRAVCSARPDRSRAGQPQADGHTGQVRDLFDSKATGWPGKYSPGGRLTGRLTQLAAAVTAHPAAGGRLLDLGCGSGELARHLAARGYQVTGCDIAPQMLRRAANADPGHTVGWIQLSPQWGTLPIVTGSVDTLVAASVLEYVSSPQAVLRECARVLRPGGLLLVTVPDVGHPVRWLEWVLARAARTPFASVMTRVWPRLGPYLSYLRISRQRRGADWWRAAGQQAGLRLTPPAAGWLSRDPLRLLTFTSTEGAGRGHETARAS